MARKPKAASATRAKARAKAKPEPADTVGGLSLEELAKLKTLEAPTFYASVFRMQGSGNDFNLLDTTRCSVVTRICLLIATPRMPRSAVTPSSARSLRAPLLDMLTIGNSKDKRETLPSRRRAATCLKSFHPA